MCPHCVAVAASVALGQKPALTYLRAAVEVRTRRTIPTWALVVLGCACTVGAYFAAGLVL